MTTASQYAAFVRSLLIELTQEGILQRQSKPFGTQIDRGNRSGYFMADDPGLLFVDQAVLRVEERFVVNAQGNIQREKYTYHYERPGGYYFRFEREQHDDDELYKPEYHLHVLWRLPHFPAPPITLEETLNVIRVNFYSDYRYRLVGQRVWVLI